MSETILERITYEHTLRHSYMRIPQQTIDSASYELRLLREASIPGTLPVAIRIDEGESSCTLEYEISGLESMASRFSGQKLRARPLAALMEQIHALLAHLEEYFLSEELVLLDPSAIFYDAEKTQWLFTLVPGYRASFHEALKALIAWLLKHIDYNEDRVVVMGYTLYNESMKEFLVMENLLRICRQNLERERILQLERGGGMPGTQGTFSPAGTDEGPTQTFASSKSNHAHAQEAARRSRMISTDGIFRPIDAGLEETPPTASGLSSASPCTQESSSHENITFHSDYGEDDYSNTVKTLQKSAPSSGVHSIHEADPPSEASASINGGNAFHHTENTEFGLLGAAPNRSYTSLGENTSPGVQISSLTAAPKSKKHFSLFHRKNEDGTDASIQKNAEKSTLKETLSTEQNQSSLKAKTLLSVALMILIPGLIWFLKGGLVLRHMLPLVLALEAGILVVIVLDHLMARLPDD